MIKRLRTTRARRGLGILAGLIVLVVIVTSLVGYLQAKPEVVFKGMLENSLRTQSVTKRIIQDDEVQSLDQVVRLQLAADHMAQGLTTLEQGGESGASVVTESIGTPTIDYVRYVSIETAQPSSITGQPLDFSAVLGRWGATTPDTETTGELYNESVLTVIPFGYLGAEKRAMLLDMADSSNVYNVNYDTMQRSWENGRPIYTYEVSVNPAAYVAYLKEYATAVGLTHLNDIDPSAYENAQPITFDVAIDVMTRRLRSINYDNGRQEQYIAYGTKADVEQPTEPISINELQSILQQIQ